MKQLKKVFAVVLALLIFGTIFTGCGAKEEKEEIHPVVGSWQANLKLADFAGKMSDEDRVLISLLAGDIIFEINATFSKDGTFSYKMDTETLKSSLSSAVNTIIGFFTSFNISLFIDRFISLVLGDYLNEVKQYYSGDYIITDDNYIVATDNETYFFAFQIRGDTLEMIDTDTMDVIMTFSRVE